MLYPAELRGRTYFLLLFCRLSISTSSLGYDQIALIILSIIPCENRQKTNVNYHHTLMSSASWSNVIGS